MVNGSIQEISLNGDYIRDVVIKEDSADEEFFAYMASEALSKKIFAIGYGKPDQDIDYNRRVEYLLHIDSTGNVLSKHFGKYDSVHGNRDNVFTLTSKRERTVEKRIEVFTLGKDGKNVIFT